MTPFDEDDLIARLQSGLAERQSGISAPPGIGEDARRAARKRTATRAIGAGVPVLAAASVATVLATSSGSGSTAAGGPSAGGSARLAPNGPVKTEDTAYIVKRVKAKIADDSQRGNVIHLYQYASGEVTSDGSLVNVGPRLDGSAYDYFAPDGTVHMRSAFPQKDGRPGIVAINVFVPVANGKGTDARTIIDYADHTYSQTRFTGVFDPSGGSTPSVQSNPSEVRQALQNGQVTQTGTTTINGTPAIALSVKLPDAPADNDLILDVDAQTYQPLRTVLSDGGSAVLLVEDWMPATPDNIAKTQADSIPTGYTKVDNLR